MIGRVKGYANVQISQLRATLYCPNDRQLKASLHCANNCCNIAVNEGNYSKRCSEQMIKRKYLSRTNITETLNFHVTA